MGPLGDEELVDRYRSETGPQRERLLNQLFERHHGRVAAWCYRMTGDVDAAADLAQEVFLKAFQHLDSFRHQSKFTTWLYSITRNHCMDALKSRPAAPLLAPDGALDQLEDLRAGELLSVLERRESQEVARQLITESLDETEAKVMTLHYVDEMPLDVVTRTLQLTNASGAKAYVVSARRKLARAFERWTRREQGKRGGGGHAESQTR
ncbi:MAG TPA: RNA polymerase sigma factor [Bryobacteraceae bacterium]|nr:RNA polymerase sigma factor [Bryobacteraceae bacterium]